MCQGDLIGLLVEAAHLLEFLPGQSLGNPPTLPFLEAQGSGVKLRVYKPSIHKGGLRATFCLLWANRAFRQGPEPGDRAGSQHWAAGLQTRETSVFTAALS